MLELYARPLLADGRLVQLLSQWADETYALYAYHHSARLQLAKVRAFLDFVVELMRHPLAGRRRFRRQHPGRSAARRRARGESEPATRRGAPPADGRPPSAVRNAAPLGVPRPVTLSQPTSVSMARPASWKVNTVPLASAVARGDERGDVGERLGARLVERGVGEAEGVAGVLLGEAHDGGEQRAGDPGAADDALAVDLRAWARLPDDEAGHRIGEHGHVGDGARRSARQVGDGRGDDVFLPRRLLVDHARAAAGAEVERARGRGRPGGWRGLCACGVFDVGRGQRAGCSPSRSRTGARAVGVERQRRATDRGGVVERRREVGRLRSRGGRSSSPSSPDEK